MMKRIFTISILFLLMFNALQAKVEHWEMVYNFMAETYYYSGSETPLSNWTNVNYEVGTTWKKGRSLIGFGEVINGCSVCVKVEKTNAIYARTKFTVKDTSSIESLCLYLQFIDGVVVYINGVEVLRKNMGEPNSPTSASQHADSMYIHEAFGSEVFRGYYIDKDKIKSCLVNGENVLALEVHNDLNDVIGSVFYSELYAGMKTHDIQFYANEPRFPFINTNDSSKLPIVKIDVNQFIPDDQRVVANIKILDNGSINHFSDKNYNYSGQVTIERRGSSSQNFPKHSYGFTTIDAVGNDTNVSLLGLPKEHDWILKGEMSDRSMIRDVLAYQLARDMGKYAPRSKFCELYLNGVNIGLFAIMEKIKRDSLRVDIAKLTELDNSGLDITGGYILKIDKTTGTNGGGFALKYAAPGRKMKPSVQFEYPKGSKMTFAQKGYIQKYIFDLEDVLRSENFMDKTNGYRKYISVKSFIDYMISQELARNIDGYRLSTFMYKEKDKDDKLGQLHMGPLWDFNLAYGYSGSLCSGTWKKTGWGYDYNEDCPSDSYYIPFWWDRLMQDPDFRTELKERWDTLRKTVLSNDAIEQRIDSLSSVDRASIDKNYDIWSDALRAFVWPNNQIGGTYDGEITYLKNFITERLAWIDANLPEYHAIIHYDDVSSSEMAIQIGQVKAYPTPFDDNLKIEFYSDGGLDVKLKIYNTTGQIVYSTNTVSENGTNIIEWNGVGSSGYAVKSGIYVYSIEINNQVFARSKILKR